MYLCLIGLLRKIAWLGFRLRLLAVRNSLLIKCIFLLIRGLCFDAKRLRAKDYYKLNFGCAALPKVSTYISALESVAVLIRLSLMPAGYAKEVK